MMFSHKLNEIKYSANKIFYKCLVAFLCKCHTYNLNSSTEVH